jgi:hypothetical protein
MPLPLNRCFVMLLIYGSRLARELRRFSIWKSRRAYFPGIAARSTATIVSVQFQISSITWAACLSLKAIPNGQEIVRWHSCGSEAPQSACTRSPAPPAVPGESVPPKPLRIGTYHE